MGREVVSIKPVKVTISHGSSDASQPPEAKSAPAVADVKASGAESRSCSNQEWLSGSIKAIGVGMGIIAAVGAVFMYAVPSSMCADDEKCGLWLTQLLQSQTAARTLFWMCGGTAYALMSFMLALDSARVWYDYVTEEKNAYLKAIKFLAVPAFVAWQTMQTYYIMLSVKASFDQVMLATVGDAAFKLFTSTMLLRRDIPYIFSKFIEYTTPNCVLTAEEIERNNHYKEGQNKYQKFLRDQYADLVQQSTSEIRTYNKLKDRQVDLSFLAADRDNWITNRNAHVSPNSILYYGGALFFAALGGLLAYVVAITTCRAVDADLQYGEGVDYTIGASYSLGSSYVFPVIMAKGYLNFLQGITNLYAGKNIEWLSYRANPSATILVTVLSGLFATLSWSSFNTFFQGNYDGAAKNELLYVVMFTMGLFQWFGMDGLYDTARSLIPGGSKNTERQVRSLGFQVENEMWMPLSKFIKDVNHPRSPEQQRLYAAAGVGSYNNENQPNSSWSRRVWCCMFNKSYQRLGEGFAPVVDTEMAAGKENGSAVVTSVSPALGTAAA